MEISNAQTALLVMDIQAATMAGLKDQSVPLLQSLKETIDAARKNGIRVIYVVVGFRKGYPEVNPTNKAFSMLKGSGRVFDTPESMAVDIHVAPAEGEPVVVKKRISAFAGSDLEVILRSVDVKHLVLTGVATSGVVLSTVRAAADKDYRLTVLHDCCADGDAEVHQVLTTKIFPRQADVMSHTEWITALK